MIIVLLSALMAFSWLLIPDDYTFAASGKVVTADASYVMADGDTLSVAEEKVLQRAQRKAVEEAGVYLEATFQDLEKQSRSRSIQTSSLEIRTIAAAITETEILERRRSFEDDRPVFFIRIRATVDITGLAEAVRRLQSEARLAEHFHQLQQENHQLRAQLKELQQQPVGVRMLIIDPNAQSEPTQRAKVLVATAIQSQDLREKIDLASEAIGLDGRFVEPYLVRGQTYLKLVSLAFAQHQRPEQYADHLEKARSDFERAVQLDGKNGWGWVGKGDVQTWSNKMDEAAASYDQALALDPFFDIARERLIRVYTMQARRQADSRHPHQALETLKKLLDSPTPESWIPYQKEAYLLRSDILLKLNRPEQALNDLSTVIRVDPTNTAALLTRAQIYLNKLQGRLAKDDFERACVLGSIAACEHLP
ncbi:MAG TPA: tetratricopeptide repeat protein [Nitrospira sp.]|nr:tetratricopeptide repeat protein [Nitrospira sp.]